MKISNKFPVFTNKFKFILQSHKNNPVYNFFLYALIIITAIFAFITYHNSFNPTYTEWYAGLAMRTAGQGYNTIEINNSNNLNNYYKIYYQSRSYPSNLFIKDEFLFQMANSLDIEPIALVPYYNPSAHMFSSFRNVFYSDKPPGESFILALFDYFFGYYGFRLAFSAIGSCLFILFFLMTDEILKNKLLAYFIAILFVFNEFIISQIFLVQGDLISLFITLLFIYSILLSFKKNNKYLFLISGMISGFLFGTRDYLVLLLLPVFALLTIISKDKFYNNIKKLRSSKIKIKNLINLVTLFEQPIYVMIGFLLIASQFFYYSYYLNENIILAHAGYGKGKSPDFFSIQNFYKLRPNLIYVGMENAFPSPFYYFINLLILFGFIIGSFVPFGIIYMFKKIEIMLSY